MTLGMNLPAVSPEGTNVLRLIYVIKNPCTACLRHVLNTHIPNGCTDIKHAVASNNQKLKPPVLTKKQYCKLFPQGQLCVNFDVSKCDMTLLYALLRNVSSVQQPSTGWGKPVSSQPRDTSIGANVERLRDLRNHIIHEDRHEISDSEFIGFWDEIDECLADIDNSLGNTTSFQQDLVSLKTCNLDAQFIEREYGKMLRKTKENQKKNMATLEEVKETVNKTFDKVSRIEEINNDQLAMTKEIKEITVKTHLGFWSFREEQHEHNITVDEQNNMIHTKNQHHACIDGGKGMLDKDIMKDAVEMCKANDDRSWSTILIKTFAYIKSNLNAKEAVQIANHLLEQQHIKPCQLEEIQNLAEKKNRSYCVDKLLKAIINGDEKHESYFFGALISVSKRFKKVLETTVTTEDISRFDQVWNKTISTGRSDATKSFDEKDIIFFQEKLSNSQEVVNSINDIMLARMHFTVRDHTNILECKESDPKIRKLCETMNACNIDVEQELRRDDLLRPSLIEVWMRHKQQRENQDSARYRPWLHATLKFVCFSRTLHFEQAVDGCVILKFSTADDFDTASLTREFVRDTLTDLLWKGYLETQMSITNPVHVTVFIMSPGKNGKDEIQFYLDFDAVDEGTGGEGNEQEMADEERRLLSEQLDLIGLSEWIMEKPDVEQITKEVLKDKLSSIDLSRTKERIAILESIYGIRNGRELIKAFCQEEDADVYKNTFVGTEQDSREKTTSQGKLNFTYEKGGGLQRLYSFKIYMNTDKNDIPMDSPGVIPDEESSKDIPVPEDSVVESEILSERSGYDPMEQRVWINSGITYIIQVGKLEDIWSDVMIIYGNDRKSLPRTIIAKVGPQIQREFNEKYPSGLKDYEVAVLSGFNLPVWKIFYCCGSVWKINSCVEKAICLKMASILVLVHDECFAETLVDIFSGSRGISGMTANKISTIYFHVDQENFDRTNLDKILESIGKHRHFKDFYTPSFGRTADPTVFTLGHTPEHANVTLTMQVGKLEEINTEAMVIFDVGKGQWPLQILSSDILEKAGPMIQNEFQNKYPAGLEYGEVAVLSGHNLPFKHIIYGVLPRWPVTWLEQVIVVFLTKCFQHINVEGIKSIAYWIPRVTYHVANLYISVLRCCMEMQIYDELFPSIPTENKVITDDCTIGQFLIRAMEEQWSNQIGMAGTVSFLGFHEIKGNNVLISDKTAEWNPVDSWAIAFSKDPLSVGVTVILEIDGSGHIGLGIIQRDPQVLKDRILSRPQDIQGYSEINLVKVHKCNCTVTFILESGGERIVTHYRDHIYEQTIISGTKVWLAIHVKFGDIKLKLRHDRKANAKYSPVVFEVKGLNLEFCTEDKNEVRTVSSNPAAICFLGKSLNIGQKLSLLCEPLKDLDGESPSRFHLKIYITDNEPKQLLQQCKNLFTITATSGSVPQWVCSEVLDKHNWSSQVTIQRTGDSLIFTIGMKEKLKKAVCTNQSELWVGLELFRVYVRWAQRSHEDSELKQKKQKKKKEIKPHRDNCSPLERKIPILTSLDIAAAGYLSQTPVLQSINEYLEIPSGKQQKQYQHSQRVEATQPYVYVTEEKSFSGIKNESTSVHSKSESQTPAEDLVRFESSLYIYFVELVTDLCSLELSDHLLSMQVITMDDHKRIMSKVIPRDQNRELLIILCKKPVPKKKFIAALKDSGNGHLSKKFFPDLEELHI